MLKELPADIRQQIEQDMRNNKRTIKKQRIEEKGTSVATNSTTTSQTLKYDNLQDSDGAQPGCSNWGPSQIRNTMERTDMDPIAEGDVDDDDCVEISETTNTCDHQVKDGISYSQVMF